MMLRFLYFRWETIHTQRVRFGWFPRGYWTPYQIAALKEAEL